MMYRRRLYKIDSDSAYLRRRQIETESAKQSAVILQAPLAACYSQ